MAGQEQPGSRWVEEVLTERTGFQGLPSLWEQEGSVTPGHVRSLGCYDRDSLPGSELPLSSCDLGAPLTRSQGRSLLFCK